ncbi:MAG: polysaccharide deacetylase [Lachnospiraceae bacterium]|nr:polysaccharide deacetylase [Lachnospiraceae bacterium]
MAKITRAQLAQRKRIDFYKKIIIYGFLVMTILPIFTSLFLFYRIGQLEKKLDYALSAEGKDYLTLLSSRDALLDNPNAKSGVFVDSVKSVLGNAEVDTNSATSTEKENAETVVDGENVPESQEGSTDVTQPDATVTNSNGKRVYLTFDDGPSIYTGQILDVLKANNIKATFFVIGREEEFYDYYKRIVDEGHTIGMHSYTHVYQDFYASKESFAEELTKLNDLIYNVTGTKSTIFRFPGGSSNSVSSLAVEEYIDYLNENDIDYYDWNSLSGDAVTNGLSPEQLVNNIMNDVSQNEDSIVLMHDLQTTHTTVESLQLLIDTLKTEGYEILPIDENTPLIQHVSADSVE